MEKLRRPFIILGLLVLAALTPIGQGNYMVYVLTSWLIFSIAAMGLNLTLGYAGQISLAQASFMAIGAYTTALLTLSGVHWIVAAPVGMALCFLVGLVLGYPALRVKGHFLAFVTLAFNTLVFLVLRNEDWLTGGSYGLVGMPRPDFGLFQTMKQIHFYYFALGITVLASLVMWGIVRSPWGRAFKALRENPVRAESLGVDTRRITLLAFAIGSTYAGLAGALVTPLVQFIEPGSFGLAHSLRILLMVVVGGSGFFFGPFVGAAVVILLPEFLRFTEGYYLIIYSGLVIAMLAFVPNGLMGIGTRLAGKIRRQRPIDAALPEEGQLK
ncbi:branched-chain amino acid ABC transporter permease [Pelagibacterium halotolerans]|uniref:ABC transporter permease protein n=1 Tax=Pelagibacterium halotolerans (strain DSM 22347 / JCM 15775 / CGMCC 1.7692 / B2) TaxID=1082931 RepID=G4R6L8_PELHB|nr:branched-chain amino acid ABC transporter permease [Pelagibacterium halotolerans]AEQ51214.1 ABC transporter permease protein [Pelagibacterium halotolerans B2]QJR18923.1 branched-chain amino acid ABC transporter permease [Pelagibacterium halotolerans]SEA68152.1 amino acid/amide ABC transporter membrane protein 2, HAAT family [Pelagibacterium halotolerans]